MSAPIRKQLLEPLDEELARLPLLRRHVLRVDDLDVVATTPITWESATEEVQDQLRVLRKCGPEGVDAGVLALRLGLVHREEEAAVEAALLSRSAVIPAGKRDLVDANERSCSLARVPLLEELAHFGL
jgi:hypothetical protein